MSLKSKQIIYKSNIKIGNEIIENLSNSTLPDTALFECLTEENQYFYAQLPSVTILLVLVTPALLSLRYVN